MSLLENLKNFRVKLKCDKCKGYLIVTAWELETRTNERRIWEMAFPHGNLQDRNYRYPCRCGGYLTPIESIMKWQYKGYNCEIKRNNYLGTYNGYVDLPKSHKYYGKWHFDIDFEVEVHGGLTWSEPEGEYWRIGFDTSHAFDFIPIYAGISIDRFTRNIWLPEGVKQEVERLVDQL